MKGRKHTPEQVVGKLREGDRLLAEGKTVAKASKALAIRELTLQPLAQPIRRHESGRSQGPAPAP
ncbi:MAG: hypothetical protein ACREPA_03770 [Candidatus Dormibacteraceae bacterium]